jgi:hypothetical protein
VQKRRRSVNGFSRSATKRRAILDLILTWTHIGQALVSSIGALAFIFALLCMSMTQPSVRGFRPQIVASHLGAAPFAAPLLGSE